MANLNAYLVQMRYFILLLWAAGLGLTACNSSSTTLSAKTEATFKLKFPTSENLEWEMEEDGIWEANFTLDGVPYSANFDNSGNWIETEYEINSESIPENVKNTVLSSFNGYKTNRIEAIERETEFLYEYELTSEKHSIEIIINSSGNVLKKKVVEKEIE